MNEIWKKIVGSNDGEVSNLGRIRRNGIIVEPHYDPEGYARCTVGGVGRKRVHVFVSEAFLTNPDNLPLIDHIDGNKANNRVENLRYVDYSENGRNATYSYQKFSKIIGTNVKTNETKIFDNQEEASNYIGCKNGSRSGEVNKVLKGKRKTTHGWSFKYME